MKITIAIDCTPAEARVFMGLPDVQPLQAEVMTEIQQRVMQTLAATDPQQLLKNWVPWEVPGAEMFQSLMRAASGAGSVSKNADPKSK